MDLPRIREGGLDAEFFAIYMDREPRPGMAITKSAPAHRCRARAGPEIPERRGPGHHRRRRAPHRQVPAAWPPSWAGRRPHDRRRPAHTPHVPDDGRAVPTLTHCFNTNWADSFGCGNPVASTHDGLSPFGREVVKELNRLGIMVDVTHTADATFYDALEVSQAPVIASHSSVDGVKEHARNMSDDMLRALARTAASSRSTRGQVHRPRGRAGDAHLRLHRPRGPCHQGGRPRPRRHRPRLQLHRPAPGLKDVYDLENITYELLKRGFDEATIRKVWGENTLRVMAETEKVAALWRRPARAAAGRCAQEVPSPSWRHWPRPVPWARRGGCLQIARTSCSCSRTTTRTR